MLKLEIKPTFENTTPKNVRWRVYFIVSTYSLRKFVENRQIHVTFVSLSFVSCRIYENCIFIISSRGYITYSDRRSGSQVSASPGQGEWLYVSNTWTWQYRQWLSWRGTQFGTKEMLLPPHLGLCGRLVWSSSGAESDSAFEWSLIKIEHFRIS